MSSLIYGIRNINIGKGLCFNLLYTSISVAKKSTILHSLGIFSSKILSSKYSTKIPEDTSQKNQPEDDKSVRKRATIEPTKYINPHDITDDDDFDKKFWDQYEKKCRDIHQSNSNPYPDRIRYRKSYANNYHRAFGILRDDFLELFGKLKHNSLVTLRSEAVQSPYIKDEIFPDYCDIIIIGGGIVGTSIAYHLQALTEKCLRVVVVEKDLSYSRASTVLSVGGIRQQFSIPENIVMSKYGMEFLQQANKDLHTKEYGTPNIKFTLSGYLTLASEEGYSQLFENYSLQRAMKAHVELLQVDELKSKFPWINTDGVAAGVLGVQREGWVDPWDLLLSINRKCKEFGVHFVNATTTNSSISIMGDKIYQGGQASPFRKVENIEVTLPTGEVRAINCAACVIAAGANSQQVGHMFGIGIGDGLTSVPIPVEPRKRFVYCYTSPNGPGLNCPLVIGPSGTYFRREGLADMYLCGSTPKEEDEPSVDNLSVDESMFEEKIWPEIAHRCPSFEKLKLQSSWAGFYDYNTFDQNAIIGRHPYYANLYMATGFSGHGFQQGPAAGKAIAELIINGEFETMNVERLSFERILMNMPLTEKCVY